MLHYLFFWLKHSIKEIHLLIMIKSLSSQRITVTKRGQELQEQLKEMMKKAPQPSSVKQYSENYKVDFNNRQNAQDQLNSYVDLVENRLKSPKQIRGFLAQKFTNTPLFVQRELDRVSDRIYKFANDIPLMSTSLPSLDFRQTQHLKSKYSSLTNADLMKKNETSSSSGFFKSAKALEENRSKKVNYVIFQEAKLERMITKYEKFNERAKYVPSYEKKQIKGEHFMQNLLKRMEGQESETRVESIQEINSKMADQLNLMQYQSQMKERLRQTMSELHSRKYQNQWKELRLPGQRASQ